MKNEKSFRAARCLLCALIFATLSFIFINSLFPPSVSSEESETVSGIIAQIFPPDTPFGTFITENIRKIAHFLEFGLLGIEVAIYVALFKRKTAMWAPVSQIFGFFVAFIDETLQIFSGRGAMIEDVWLDIFGFAALSSLAYITAFLIKNKIQSKENTNG